jgi:hypothetical protein
MKTLLIPGWMKSVGYYGEFDGLDIWKNDFVLSDNRSVQCVVAHSMGAAYALAEEKVGNENTRYFLINPIINKISFFSWVWRWMKFALMGGIKADPQMSVKNIFAAIKKAIAVSRYDLDKVIAAMPKENVVIIRGSQDDYFCDKRTIEEAKKYGLKIVEVDGLGHEWDAQYKDVLDSLIT